MACSFFKDSSLSLVSEENRAREDGDPVFGFAPFNVARRVTGDELAADDCAADVRPARPDRGDFVTLRNLESGAVVKEKIWGVGASGHELAINASIRRDLIHGVDVVGNEVCRICLRPDVAAAMEAVVMTGSMDQCLLFLRESAPTLAHMDVVRTHMTHAIKDSVLLEKHMVQTLLMQSYEMTWKLGLDYAMRITTEHGEMCVPNKQNINGYATLSNVFLKFLKAKHTLKQ